MAIDKTGHILKPNTFGGWCDKCKRQFINAGAHTAALQREDQRKARKK